MSNIHGLGDSKGGGGKDDKKKKAQETYVGGKSSGLNVVDADDDDDDEHIFDKLQAMKGAGGGGGGAAGGGGGPPGSKVEVTFYKNGFTIDDDDTLHSLDTAGAKAFDEDVDKGVVPSVVQKAIQKNHPPSGGSVGVSLNDKRADVYVPPFKPFGGTGTALGSSSSSSTPASAIFTPSASSNASSSSAAAASKVVDTTKETVTVQVKLVDGRRETITLNATHTIGDLQAKVASLNGTPKPFILKAGFPPAALGNPALTLGAASLKNAMVMQFVA